MVKPDSERHIGAHPEHLRPINRMTRYTFEYLTKKLGSLRQETAEHSKAIGEAGGTNDFHDNFAFDEANRLYETGLAQISEIEKQLLNVEFITPRQDTTSVGIGNEVDVTYDGKESFTITLLSPLDAAVPDRREQGNWTSYKSILGDALLGRCPGDAFHIPKRNDLGHEIGTFTVVVNAIRPGNF